MKIQVFAVLKEHFDNEFEIHDAISNIEALKIYLIQKNKRAEHILQQSRFAIDDCFVPSDHLLYHHDHISIIPPSSGG